MQYRRLPMKNARYCSGGSLDRDRSWPTHRLLVLRMPTTSLAVAIAAAIRRLRLSRQRSGSGRTEDDVLQAIRLPLRLSPGLLGHEGVIPDRASGCSATGLRALPRAPASARCGGSAQVPALGSVVGMPGWRAGRI
jgi:hypothetical protein